MELLSALSQVMHLESLRAAKGSHISPDKLAKRLNMTLAELGVMVGLHRNTLSRSPASPEVQRKLSVVTGILQRMMSVTGADDTLAAFWFRYEHLAGFGPVTAADLVQEGNADAVLAFLQMVEDGVPA